MSPKIVDKTIKRESILRAAIKVFARRSIHDFKMSDIATEAGVGKGTLYEYFQSKEALVAGTYEFFLGEYQNFMANQLAVHKNPAKKIELLISSLFAFLDTNKDLIKVIYDYRSAAVPRQGGKVFIIGLQRTYNETIDFIVSLINDGINKGFFRNVEPRLQASLIVALMDGIMYQVLIGVLSKPSAVPERLGRMIVENLLKKE